jgi:hypothetical protein
MQQLAVRIMQYFATSDLQEFAGGGKFGSALLPQFGAIFHASSIMRCLAVGEAQDAGFYPVSMRHEERSAKGAAFVVRMGGDTKQAKRQAESSGGK